MNTQGVNLELHRRTLSAAREVGGQRGPRGAATRVTSAGRGLSGDRAGEEKHERRSLGRGGRVPAPRPLGETYVRTFGRRGHPGSVHHDYSPPQPTRVVLVTSNWTPHASRRCPQQGTAGGGAERLRRAGPRVPSARAPLTLTLTLTRAAARPPPRPDAPGAARPPRSAPGCGTRGREARASARPRLLGHCLCGSPAPRGRGSVLTTP